MNIIIALLFCLFVTGTLAWAAIQAAKMFYRINFIEKFKYEESAKERMDIGTTKAIELWFKRGYDKNFDKNFKLHLITLITCSNAKDKIESVYVLYRKCVNRYHVKAYDYDNFLL